MWHLIKVVFQHKIECANKVLKDTIGSQEMGMVGIGVELSKGHSRVCNVWSGADFDVKEWADDVLVINFDLTIGNIREGVR